ncbi:toll/interleukin-1 receptor domain-containing protein [Streptomyces sp. NPDC058231]|uniref:toll/interleukin-1 receptor domain-containing protein n=1 Tax=Streptomyces sp. NPDC058231 TaxID=3346392 RepID=UPI0036E7939D
MQYFVSYSRRDNSQDGLRRVRELLIAREATSVYVDDLELHDPAVDRVESVVKALHQADVFCALYSSSYLRSEWTRWEFDVAVASRTQMIALLPDGTFARPGSSEWPWLTVDEAQDHRRKLLLAQGPPTARVPDVWRAPEVVGRS